MESSDQLTEAAGLSSMPSQHAVTRARGSVIQKALRTIQERIRSGAYPPGMPLPPQRKLAEDLQVSRASLREALSILDTLGMLRIEQGRGTFVAAAEGAEPAEGSWQSWRFTARYSAEEVYQFRAIAEPAAAALAATRVDAEAMRQLEDNLQLFKDATRETDLVTSSQLDFEFHRLIMTIASNRLLLETHLSYAPVMLESQRLPLSRRDRLWEPVVEHERIVEALRMRDPEGARYYMRLHVSRAAGRVNVRLADVGG